MRAYTTFNQSAIVEFIEKRSRFIGAAAPVQSEEEAMAFLAARRLEHREARHNCWAYILRDNAQRMSDDGEPQGTAGLPILEVLRREGVADAIIVVTRYFGGTLLGAPGLVRAYGHTAKLVLDAAEKREMTPCKRCAITLDYAQYDIISTLLKNLGATVINSDFAAAVNLELRIAENDFGNVSAQITERTNGAAQLVITGEEFA